MPTRLTQVLRSIGSRPAPGCTRFGENGSYQLAVANSIESRRRCWSMVYGSYLEKGFAEPRADRLWYGPYDALPETTSFLVSRDGVDTGTLTVVFDSPGGLPADKVFGDELDRLRDAGRRPSEMISLASVDRCRRGASDSLLHLFRLAWLTALHLERSTDLVITVNPRHQAFYQRSLAFTVVGETRSYDKVGGAPAVLLRLDLADSLERCRDQHGDAIGSLYHFFADPMATMHLLRFLRQERRPLDERAFAALFGARLQLPILAELEKRIPAAKMQGVA
jgi:hypothetical protein